MGVTAQLFELEDIKAVRRFQYCLAESGGDESKSHGTGSVPLAPPLPGSAPVPLASCAAGCLLLLSQGSREQRFQTIPWLKEEMKASHFQEKQVGLSNSSTLGNKKKGGRRGGEMEKKKDYTRTKSVMEKESQKKTVHFFVLQRIQDAQTESTDNTSLND